MRARQPLNCYWCCSRVLLCRRPADAARYSSSPFAHQRNTRNVSSHRRSIDLTQTGRGGLSGFQAAPRSVGRRESATVRRLTLNYSAGTRGGLGLGLGLGHGGCDIESAVVGRRIMAPRNCRDAAVVSPIHRLATTTTICLDPALSTAACSCRPAARR